MRIDMEFDKNKFKALIHYIISKYDEDTGINRTILFKLLYFSEFNYYELKERLITGESYLKWDYGPVPKDFLEAKNELIREGKIKENKQMFGDFKKYTYTALTKANMNLFSQDEKESIINTLNKLCGMSASQISVYSHGDMPWQAAKENEEIEPEFVFYRDPEYCTVNYD